MTKIYKRLLTLGIATTLCFSLAACGKKDNKSAEQGKKEGVKITVGIPATNIETSNIKYHAEKWGKLTGNTLEIQAVDDNQFDQLLMTKLSSGGMWDMFMRYTGTQASKYNHEKNFVDLTKQEWVGKLNETVMPFLKVNDKVYGFPTGGINSFGIVYNKDVFSKLGLSVPKTFDEFNAVCEKIKAAGITPIYVSMKDGWTVNQIVNAEWPNLLTAHPESLDKLNKNDMRWDDIPEFINIFERLAAWRDKGYFNKDMATASYEMALKSVGEGKAAMYYMGDWADPEIPKLVESAKGKIGLMAAPTKDGKSYIAAAGPGAIYVSNKSKNVEACTDFLKYLSSEEAIKYDFETKKCTSVWKGMENDKVSVTLADSQVYFKEGKSQSHYNQTYVITPSAEAESTFSSVLLGQKSPKEAAKQWSDEVIKVGKSLGFSGFDK